MDRLIIKRTSAFLFDGLLVAPILLWAPGSFWWLIGIGYFLLRDAVINGRSIGKFIVGLTVMDRHKNACGFMRSILRNLLLFFPGPPIEFFVLAFSMGGRRLGDRLAKTQVIDTRPYLRGVWFLLLTLSLSFLLIDLSRPDLKAWEYWENPPRWRELVQSKESDLEARFRGLFEYFGWEMARPRDDALEQPKNYVIYLRDGRKIEAEEYWDEGDSINYRKLGGIIGVDRSKVAMIENTVDGTRRRYNPFYRDRSSSGAPVPSGQAR